MTTRKTSQDRKAKQTPEPKLDPRFELDEYELTYTTKAGEALVLSLDVPTGVMIDAMDGSDERAQIVGMLRSLGDEENLERYRSLGWLSEGQLVTTTYFQQFKQLHRATVGES